jgi:phage portal protein BeeE
LAGAFINFFSRLFPGWMRLRHTSLQRVDYFRQRQGYWQQNSIYLDNIINKIATDVAQLKFKHVKIIRNANSPDDLIWYEQSDLSQCLTISPNDYETPTVFWSNVVRKILNDQVAVVVPTYNNGQLQSINLADGIVDFQNHRLIVQIDCQTFDVDINSVWIFQNPKENISAQLGQITRLIDDNLRALSYKLSENNAKLKGFLKIPTKAEDGELKRRAEMRVKNIMDSAQDAGIGFLQQGEEFQELNQEYGTASENEMEFLKGQLYNAFGINNDLFTCNYTEEQYRAYFQSVLKVYQRVIAEEVNRKFFSKTARTQGQRLLVYYDMYDISSLKDLNEFAFKMKYSGVLNANEIREIFGYGSYAGGEIFESNKNAVQIGTDTTDTEITLE